ncbi:MAG TPA: class I tRNA ligase family protein [bacterium]|nr:class I tRNA ligase family protein [bacterium]HPN67124.1 class I tRNA ligase family protein [bacterium]
MKQYNPGEIEPKWQSVWKEEKIFQAADFDQSKPKYYLLFEFPYPSGEGLHVGHARANSAIDALARIKRMQGFNVLFPTGYDAFGLPAENYAIKTGTHPAETTKRNIDHFRRQMQSMGLSIDWDREVNTTDPDYYRWTQWIFLQLYQHGLAYRAKKPINWCPSCQVGLANEEVVDGRCDRCGTVTTKKELEQWMLKITAYADRLIDDLAAADYPEKVKAMQINWIGRSTGAAIKFSIFNPASGPSTNFLEVFTTRADTLFGVTFMVIAPEHELVKNITTPEHAKEVADYVATALAKSNIERQENKDKTGVFTGSYAVNPINNEQIPIWIADYVLPDYGTGAIMAVPAHDERDYAFAKKFDLPIKEVVIPKIIDSGNPPRADKPTVVRRAIQAIVINPRTHQILTLRWKQFPWTTFVVGGVKDNETLIDAAVREVAEETGYHQLKYIRTLGGPVQSNFFAAHKDENRQAIFSALVFELLDDSCAEIDPSEKEKHEASWVTWEEMARDPQLQCSEFSLWQSRFAQELPALFVDKGVCINSSQFDNLDSVEAAKQIIDELAKRNLGQKTVNYKLRDWVFSRQRYWGEPIPIVYCDQCGEVPLPEDQLPLTLPEVANYAATNTGESPLANIAAWVNTTCSRCGGPAKRETNTMPQWAGSSWYWLRFVDPRNNTAFADQRKLAYWTPVDLYNGGMEHTTLHLLYSRFWHKFLYDQGLVPTIEPFQKRISHGYILGEGGIKMSKSKGNIVNPDDIISEYGADTLRGYEMFIGPYSDTAIWDTNGIKGVYRWLTKIWNLAQEIILVNEKIIEDPMQWTYDASEIREVALAAIVNRAIKKIGEEYDRYAFNTAISHLMIFVNDLLDYKTQLAFAKDPLAWRQTLEALLLLLSPSCPHIAEELWQQMGHQTSIGLASWPQYDAKLIAEESITVPVQVNGKRRAEIVVSSSATEAEALQIAKEMPNVAKFIADKTIVKEIYVSGKIINIVVK